MVSKYAITFHEVSTPISQPVTKFGGQPVWLTGPEWPEFPAGVGWRLLLQLDSTIVPFSVNFGDARIAYALLSSDGTQGKFLWQCA